MRKRRSDCKQVECICPTCGTTFLRRPSVISPVNYCSRACFAAAIKGKPTPAGEAHPRWKGDAAKVNSGRMRAISRYPAQPCEACGATPETTRIHRHHRDQNTRNNAPENIAFLCPPHHAAEHRRLRGLAIAKENAP